MISTCCERWFNAQEEMLALFGTQRHVDGPLCISYRNMACSVVCPSQTARQLASLHIPGMVLFVHGQELYI